ncbi:protein containing TonB family C-terminal domain [Lentimicrobium saccharophilum]|uniref:Protein containing TonB family C-terminal domain n=1 Tax=Lentimicrobium saccharophilum TaxID=1678841 RepID=A0A0S7C3R0_9BACT|nr:energy transducer TonB [Lentimicrobium saccharophilum]GAP44070.1 protein containing TonB family C-terminal domain [Lentimicrobium saccharophilum]
METRKNSNADLERKRFVFLQLGLILSLGVVLAAFEWKTPDAGNIDLPPRTYSEPEMEIIDIIPVKKELPKPVNTTLIREVDNLAEDLPEIEIEIETDPLEFIPPFELPGRLPDEETVEEQLPFVIVEKMPQFPGGEAGLMRYLAENIRYPGPAREAGISGTVYITFVVEPDGRVTSVKILRGLPGGCSEEAERVVKMMPDWEPGRQAGKAVRVALNLPVVFRLIQ